LIIRGYKETKITALQMTQEMDDGDIILQDELHLTGYELNDELRKKTGEKNYQHVLRS
jgi:methionyl-tRNA formyltransferase